MNTGTARALLLTASLAISSAHADTTTIEETVAAGEYMLAAELLDLEMMDAPRDPQPKFRKAQVLRYAGEFEAAAALLGELRSEYPGDVDYAFERALVRIALGENEGALEDLDAAIQLSPDYEDLWILRFRILSRDFSAVSEETIADWQSEAERRFPDAAWYYIPESRSEADWTLTVGGGYDELDRGFADWNRQFVAIAREVVGSHRHAVELSRNARSSTADYVVGATAEYTLTSNWLAGAYIGFGADPDFMPEVDIAAHGGRVLANGWILDLGVRYRDYTGTEVFATNVMIEKYVGAFRAAYRFSVSSLPDSPSFNSHGLTLNWFYSDAANLGLSMGAGREIESLGGGRLLETDVTSISLSGRHAISERTSLDWWAGIHDQGDLYRRRFFGLAVSFQL